MTDKRANIYTLLALFMVIVIDAIGIGLVYPLLAPLFSAKVGGILPAGTSMIVRNICYGLTLSAFPLALFFGSPVLGDLSDAIGRKKVLLICLFGESLGMVIAGVAVVIHSVVLLLFSRAFTGFLAGSQSTAQAAIIDIAPQGRKDVYLSVVTLAISSGFILGPLLSGIFANKNLFSWFHYDTPFFVAAVLAIVNATMLLFTFKETHRTVGRVKIKLLQGLSMFIAAFSDDNIRILAIIYVCVQTAWSVFIQYVAMHMVEYFHYTVGQVGHFYMWIASMVAFASLIIIRIVARYSRVATYVFYMLLFAISGAAMGLCQVEKWQWLAVVPVAIGAIVAVNGILTLFSDSVSNERQGWVMGVANSVSSLAWTIGGLLAGLFVLFSYVVPYVAMILLLLTAASFTAAKYLRHRSE